MGGVKNLLNDLAMPLTSSVLIHQAAVVIIQLLDCVRYADIWTCYSLAALTNAGARRKLHQCRMAELRLIGSRPKKTIWKTLIKFAGHISFCEDQSCLKQVTER